MLSKYLKHKDEFECALGIETTIHEDKIKITSINNESLFMDYVIYLIKSDGDIEEYMMAYGYETFEEYYNFLLNAHKDDIEAGRLYLFIDDDDFNGYLLYIRKFKLKKLLEN